MRLSRNTLGKDHRLWNNTSMVVGLSKKDMRGSNQTSQRGNGHARSAYGIWCVVSGGLTGHREAWLKQDGVVMEFPTEAAATAEAAHLMAPRRATMAQARRKGVIISYTARMRT